MGRVDADGDTVAVRRGHGVDQGGHLLEARPDGGSAPGGHFHEKHDTARNTLERHANRLGVPRDAARAVIHEIAWMRHEVLHTQRFASPKLRPERLERPGPQAPDPAKRD